MTRRLVLPLVALAVVASASLPAAPPQTAAKPANVVALVGGTLIDGFGSTPLRNSVVIVEGERIKAVGQVGTLAVPAGAQVISTDGMSVLPGLWDMHVHLMINGHSDYAHWDKTYPARFEKEIMPAAAHQLLLAGVTSRARSRRAARGEHQRPRSDQSQGKIPGPTLYVSGPFIQHAPYPGTELFRWGVSGVADASAKVQTLAKAGVDVVKLIDQDQMTPEELKAVVDEAHANGLPVVGALAPAGGDPPAG